MEDGSWTRDLPADVQNCVMEDGWIRVDVRRRRHQRVSRSVRRLQLLDRGDVPAVDPCPRRIGLDSDRPCGDWRFCLRCAQADLLVEDALAADGAGNLRPPALPWW